MYLYQCGGMQPLSLPAASMRRTSSVCPGHRLLGVYAGHHRRQQCCWLQARLVALPAVLETLSSLAAAAAVRLLLCVDGVGDDGAFQTGVASRAAVACLSCLTQPQPQPQPRVPHRHRHRCLHLRLRFLQKVGHCVQAVPCQTVVCQAAPVASTATRCTRPAWPAAPSAALCAAAAHSAAYGLPP